MKKKIVGILLTLLVSACAVLTPAEQAQVAKDGLEYGTCAAEAHLCKMAAPSDAGLAPCWAEYDACLARTGMTDAGGQ